MIKIKKNASMRIGAVLLVLTIATFCLISGTLAKYTSSFAGYDEARVAKFDLSMTASGVALDNTNQQINIFNTVTDDNVLINDGVNKDASDMKLIAPGTTGNFDIVFDNNSEVSVQFEFTLTETQSTPIPIVYTYDSLNYSSVAPVDGEVGGMTIAGDISDLAAAINANSGEWLVNSHSGTAETASIVWTWAFEADDAQTDTIDTALGLDGTDTVNLSISCIATQID